MLCWKVSQLRNKTIVWGLEKLHSFAMKMGKKEWQIGTLTSPLLSRWHIDT